MCVVFFYENITLILHLKYTIQLLFQLKIKETPPKVPANSRHLSIVNTVCSQKDHSEITWFISHYLLREDWLQGSEVLDFWFVPSPLCPGVEKYGLLSLPPVLIWQYKPFNFMFSCPSIHNSLSLGEKSIFVPKSFLLGAWFRRMKRIEE